MIVNILYRFKRKNVLALTSVIMLEGGWSEGETSPFIILCNSLKCEHLLGAANINLNRKVLADLAITDPAAFAKVVEALTRKHCEALYLGALALLAGCAGRSCRISQAAFCWGLRCLFFA